MRNYHKFYIDGQWADPIGGGDPCDVINPATEEVAGTIRMGSEADVDRAVAAAHRAFQTYSRTPLKERLELMAAIINEYQKRLEDIAAAVTEDMGAPLHTLSRHAQAPIHADAHAAVALVAVRARIAIITWRQLCLVRSRTPPCAARCHLARELNAVHVTQAHGLTPRHTPLMQRSCVVAELPSLQLVGSALKSVRHARLHHRHAWGQGVQRRIKADPTDAALHLFRKIERGGIDSVRRIVDERHPQAPDDRAELGPAPVE